MTQQSMAELVEDMASIRGIFITAMPDCLLFDSWVREEGKWAAEEVASYFGDLVRANRQGLKALGAWSSDMQVTIESSDTMVLLHEIGNDFVAGLIFDRETPMGMVRLHLKHVLERLRISLPSVQAEDRPRGVLIMEFLKRYAPDPHASIMRLALQTGIELEQLNRPEGLPGQQIPVIEEAVCNILGLDSLNL